MGVMQAVQLRDTLAERVKAAGSSAADRRAALQGLSADFHAKLPSVLEFPWTVATGDARWCSPGVNCTVQGLQAACTRLHAQHLAASSISGHRTVQKHACTKDSSHVRCRGGSAALREGATAGAVIPSRPRH